ncbi:NAD(P)/FAD-dependent oxidoreductase [Streptomyces griseocarneus]|uniref:NAD(P)/FAD-dependent oxidoreductase n=1 Tax=Streptomyces griseocarneus TaxID=51201 RepID=UPI00167EF40D|nr:FAD-dependent oxidoreductase [Streptomyces griseocarneus]MBZ6474243.1 FAD-dependent oxidoreductase [Streptomyces griseocarneus]GHG52826.1 nitrite reductase [Streptomyces griseocarneus]
MTPRRIAVVGAGMAAARFAHQALALAGPGELDITLYGREPHAPYNRALLTGVLAGRYGATALGLPTGGAAVRAGAEVTDIDPAARTLRTATGEAARYDALVLATGAGPLPAPVPPPPAADRPDADGHRAPERHAPRRGVHVLRSLADAARLTEDVPLARRATVVGGGALGVDAARVLAGRGLRVHLVHRAPHLMDRHLDAGAAAVVRRGLEAVGVTVLTGREVTALLGGARVTGLAFADGGRHATDLVVLACGVRPRTRLARAAGLTVRDGVVVDDTLATSAPGVYAIGDCAEHRGVVHGRAEAAWAQADVLAARLSGARPGARYAGSPRFLRLSAGGLQVAAIGDSTGDSTGGDGSPTDTVHLADATRGSYKKLLLRGDRLVGALLVGDLTGVADLTAVHERSEPVPRDPLHLLTTEGALQ